MALFGDPDEAAVMDRLMVGTVGNRAEAGCPGPWLFGASAIATRTAVKRVDVVDTTAAGDSFNAGYLAARMRGAAPDEAARAGHALASQVIGYRGAILPRDVPLAR
jgi:2-dehydro-3-deoxygluconokinase